ncbi:hypothetical protein [Neoactinobaculum massilliense]|uniref:hypothetical protein n=1 Tax=Neoactinobaculum massilliense TaxID=2364794 RepID=UPI000F53C40E|nr:hypothetical protein [Neoactinobaculum massilliense]
MRGEGGAGEVERAVGSDDAERDEVSRPVAGGEARTLEVLAPVAGGLRDLVAFAAARGEEPGEQQAFAMLPGIGIEPLAGGLTVVAPVAGRVTRLTAGRADILSTADRIDAQEASAPGPQASAVQIAVLLGADEPDAAFIPLAHVGTEVAAGQPLMIWNASPLRVLTSAVVASSGRVARISEVIEAGEPAFILEI